MASGTNNRLQVGVRTEHEQFTPEPSVEPEHQKGTQAPPESSDQSNPAAGPAGTPNEPSPDTNANVEPAGQSDPVEGEPKGSEPGNSATGGVGQAASSTGEFLNSGQPPPEVSDVRAREVERIMATDPRLPTSAEFVNANEEDAQTSGNTDSAASTTSEAWPWVTDLTHDGKRIMAYRTHGRGHRAVVEGVRGGAVLDIRSGMQCGGTEMKRCLAQEGIKQLNPPATRRKWSYEQRSDFRRLWYIALSDYKTHNSDSKSGSCRKDPEAWAFVEWDWGFEEITVSDLRKVVGRESADAAIRTICEANNCIAPMELRPQQIIIKTTADMFTGDRLKQTHFDAGSGGDLPHVSDHSKQAAHDALPPKQPPNTNIGQVEPNAGLDLSSVLREMNRKLDLPEDEVKIVDELSKNTTVLAQIVDKLATKVGITMDG
ncbi:hypothetical protein N0V95_008975 [Ascochyta clinopodiicola]|nr:hypothetical protein N0V95_008975 [Ascochyta clinopodiicola]